MRDSRRTTETMTRGIRRTSGHVAQAENFYPDNAIDKESSDTLYRCAPRPDPLIDETGLTPPTSPPGLGPLKGYSGTAPAKRQ